MVIANAWWLWWLSTTPKEEIIVSSGVCVVVVGTNEVWTNEIWLLLMILICEVTDLMKAKLWSGWFNEGWNLMLGLIFGTFGTGLILKGWIVDGLIFETLELWWYEQLLNQWLYHWSLQIWIQLWMRWRLWQGLLKNFISFWFDLCSRWVKVH